MTVLHATTKAIVYRPQAGYNEIGLNISCQSYLGELIKGATVSIAYSVATKCESSECQPSVREYPVVLKTGEAIDL